MFNAYVFNHHFLFVLPINFSQFIQRTGVKLPPEIDSSAKTRMSKKKRNTDADAEVKDSAKRAKTSGEFVSAAPEHVTDKSQGLSLSHSQAPIAHLLPWLLFAHVEWRTFSYSQYE